MEPRGNLYFLSLPTRNTRPFPLFPPAAAVTSLHLHTRVPRSPRPAAAGTLRAQHPGQRRPRAAGGDDERSVPPTPWRHTETTPPSPGSALLTDGRVGGETRVRGRCAVWARLLLPGGSALHGRKQLSCLQPGTGYSFYNFCCNCGERTRGGVCVNCPPLSVSRWCYFDFGWGTLLADVREVCDECIF